MADQPHVIRVSRRCRHQASYTDFLKDPLPGVIPPEIYEPGPWYRILIGEVDHKGERKQVWLWCGLDNKTGDDKDVLYWVNRAGSPAPSGVIASLVADTIPQALRSGGSAIDAARKLFRGAGLKRFKLQDLSKSQQKDWRKRRNNNQHAEGSSEPALKKQKNSESTAQGSTGATNASKATPRSLSTANQHAAALSNNDSEEVALNDVEVEARINKFDQEVSEYVLTRWGGILERQRGFPEPPPLSLLRELRSWGKASRRDDPAEIFHYSAWKDWIKRFESAPVSHPPDLIAALIRSAMRSEARLEPRLGRKKEEDPKIKKQKSLR
jgi:hypothetical protein